MSEKPKGPPVDQAARDAARESLGRSCLLEAGAGTGKTSVLLARVLEILKTSVPLEKIAVITFTEKAAGELKLKLRQRIEEMIRKAGDSPWGGHLRESLEALDRAAISTIHAFAASLLRERPVEAQVDPRFTVADGLASRMLMEDTWARWIEGELSARTRTLERALRLGITLRQIRNLAFAALNNRDIEPTSQPDARGELEAARDRVVSGIDEAVGLLGSCSSPGDAGYRMLRELEGRVPALQSANGDRLLMEMAGLNIKATSGAKKNWNPASDLTTVKKLMADLKGVTDSAVTHARTAFAGEMIAWLRRGYLHNYRVTKESRRLLDFTDLILICRNMLRDSVPARAAFQDRFDCILVDEFQDTDPLQSEILFLLASDDPAQNDWSKCNVVEGKLFLVGDPKQSIYRFRRADIEIYDSVKGRMPSRLEPLTQSFRSAPSILSWVNDLFENLMHPGEGEQVQPDYEAIIPYRDEPEPVTGDAASRVMILIPPGSDEMGVDDEGEHKVEKLRKSEACHIAALVKKVVGEEWPVPGADGKPRPIRYADIALLFRASTAYEVYEEVLRDQAIPYRITGGKRYYLRAEMRALEAVLRAIESPYDPLAVVSALRCPIFGHSDEDFLGHTSARRSWCYTTESARAGTPFERAFELLDRLHRQRNSRSIALTLEDLFESTGALALFHLKPDGDQRAANLLKAIDFARAHEHIGGTTFGSFVHWLSEMAEEEREEGEAPLAEEPETDVVEQSGDAIRISTVHKAKGLEFPFVVLCDSAGLDRATILPTIVERGQADKPRLEFCFGAGNQKFVSMNYDQALEREKARLEAEKLRLLYVATTRARDFLVIPAFTGARKPTGICAMLDKAGFLPPKRSGTEPVPLLHRGALLLDGGKFDIARYDPPPLRVMSREATPEDRSYLLEREGWRRALNVVLTSQATGRVFRTASGLEGATHSGGAPATPGTSYMRAGGRQLGTAVHAVLERIDLRTSADIGLLSEEEATRVGRPDLAEEVIKFTRRAIGSNIVKEALSSPRFYREVPFAVVGEGYLAEGRADLLFEEGGGLTVVDFKTDQVESEEEIEARANAYRPQALVYARALGQVSGLTVRRVVLHFVKPCRDWEFRVDEAFLLSGRRLLESGSMEPGA